MTKVERRELPAELAARLEMPTYFECEMTLDDDAGTATILTGRVPQAWLEMQSLNEPATAAGVFIKLLAPPTNRPRRIVRQPRDRLASRRSREPPFVSLGKSVLGELGVDVGLFDVVRQRRPISGRRARSVLSNARRRRATSAPINWLDLPTADLASVQNTGPRRNSGSQHPKCTASRPTRSSELQLAHEVQARAAKGRSASRRFSTTPKTRSANSSSLEGTVRRVTRIDVGKSPDGAPSDVARRFGIDHYYELDVFTDDSQNNPIVFCVRELPPGFPIGDGLHEPVRIAGFFFKSWSFESRRATLPTAPDGTPRRRELRQFAPLRDRPQPDYARDCPTDVDVRLRQLRRGRPVCAAAGGDLGDRLVARPRRSPVRRSDASRPVFLAGRRIAQRSRLRPQREPRARTSK